MRVFFATGAVFSLLKFAACSPAGAVRAVGWGQTRRSESTGTRAPLGGSSSPHLSRTSHHLLWPHLGRRREQEQSPSREKEQEAGELEEEEKREQGEEQEEEEDLTRPGEPPPHCCPLGKSPLLPQPRDNSGPLSTAARLLVTRASTTVQPMHATFPHPPSHPDLVPNSLLSHRKSHPPPGKAEPAHV